MCRKSEGQRKSRWPSCFYFAISSTQERKKLIDWLFGLKLSEIGEEVQLWITWCEDASRVIALCGDLTPVVTPKVYHGDRGQIGVRTSDGMPNVIASAGS